jgi:mannobiose 2-epimerase
MRRWDLRALLSVWHRGRGGGRGRPAAPPAASELARSRALVTRLLLENIVPFWEARERAAGTGEPAARSTPEWHLVLEARTAWFFARLAGSSHGRADHLRAAQRRFEFLRDVMWDRDFGGFLWQVRARDGAPTRPDKHPYGQAFGLYALSEFAAASGSSAALDLARQLFDLLETRAHDAEHGGYREGLLRDWTPLPDTARTYLGVAPEIKTMNTHLHLLEAITTFYRVSGDPVARERLVELILIQGSAVVREGVGVCTEAHRRDWTALGGPAHERVSYGHDVENARLLLEACEAVGLPTAPLIGLSRTLFAHPLRFGFDHRQGGFFKEGPYYRSADRREKIWWIQAEGLLSALELYRRTAEPEFFRCFQRTLDWIVDRQADWTGGEWHAEITTAGAPLGAKVGPWKGPYHTGRAVIQGLESLAAL